MSDPTAPQSQAAHEAKPPWRFPRRAVVLATSVAAVIVVAVLVVIFLAPKGGVAPGSLPTVPVENLGAKPHLVPWPDSPISTEGTNSESVQVAGTTAQDQGLFYWTNDSGSHLSLANTANGTLDWTIPWNYPGAVLVSAPDATPLLVANVVALASPVNSVVALDPKTGKSLGSIKLIVGLPSTDTNLNDTSFLNDLGALNGEYTGSGDDVTLGGTIDELGGDVIVETATSIARYSPSDLRHPKWTAKMTNDGGFVSHAAGIVFAGGRTFSESTGKPVTWKSPVSGTDTAGFSTGGSWVGETYSPAGDDNDRILFGLKPGSLSPGWTVKIGKNTAILALHDGHIVYFDGSKVVSISAATGHQEWSRGTSKSYFPVTPPVQSGDSGDVLLMYEFTENENLIAVDLRNGKTLYQVASLANHADTNPPIAVSPQYYYLSAYYTNMLEAVSVSDGAQRWAISYANLDGTGSDAFRVVQVGGHLLVIAAQWQADESNGGDLNAHKVYSIDP